MFGTFHWIWTIKIKIMTFFFFPPLYWALNPHQTFHYWPAFHSDLCTNKRIFMVWAWPETPLLLQNRDWNLVVCQFLPLWGGGEGTFASTSILLPKSPKPGVWSNSHSFARPYNPFNSSITLSQSPFSNKVYTPFFTKYPMCLGYELNWNSWA